MSVLSHDEILKAIDAGEIKISPYKPDAVGAASVDLTLANEFRLFNPGHQPLDVTETTDYRDITEHVVLPEGEPLLLSPGQACLGITEEHITLSPGICGLLEGRSRFARLGLFVHITAGFMSPGISNRQVLEIVNTSNRSLNLYPGVRMCQFIFMKMAGEAKYNGKFQEQKL